jgi:hypothetical protein
MNAEAIVVEVKVKSAAFTAPKSTTLAFAAISK